MSTEQNKPQSPAGAEADKHAHQTSFGGRIRNYFLTGLVLVAPVAITVYVLYWFANWVDGIVRPFIPWQYRPETYLPVAIPGTGLVIAFVVLTLLGFLTANFVGRKLVAFGDSLLHRMPIVRPIYRTREADLRDDLFHLRPNLPQSRPGRVSGARHVVAGVRLAAADPRGRRSPAGDRARLGVSAVHPQPDDGVLLLSAAAGRDRPRHFGRGGDDRADVRRRRAAKRATRRRKWPRSPRPQWPPRRCARRGRPNRPLEPQPPSHTTRASLLPNPALRGYRRVKTDFGMQPMVLTWIGIALCVAQSAMFSGLNLAALSIPRLRLELEANAGNRNAQKVIELRRDTNLLLCTIVWGNIATNVVLTLLSESVLTGVGAFVFSTFVITLFGEIFPQAYFSRNAIRIAAFFSPMIKFYQVILYIVAKPTALVLEYWLGPEGVHVIPRARLPRADYAACRRLQAPTSAAWKRSARSTSSISMTCRLDVKASRSTRAASSPCRWLTANRFCRHSRVRRRIRFCARSMHLGTSGSSLLMTYVAAICGVGRASFPARRVVRRKTRSRLRRYWHRPLVVTDPNKRARRSDRAHEGAAGDPRG